MNKFDDFPRDWRFFAPIFLSALAGGCGGSGGGSNTVVAPGGMTDVAPTVTALVPLANATGVAVSARAVTAAFSAPMDPQSLSSSTFLLACPAGVTQPVAVSLSADGRLATLTTANNLPANTTCTVALTAAVKNATGTPMASPFSWTFATGAAADNTAPTVAAVAPLANSSAVLVNTRIITAAFSEAVDPLTLSAATFKLACMGAAAQTGSVGYATNGNLATLTLSGDLPGSTICTGTITSSVRDLAGNALANPFVWSFTTGAVPDTTAPTVASIIPVANSSGVALNTSIIAVLSEPMDPSSITDSTFKLACPTGVAIPATVSYGANGNAATLTPAANLPASTNCTATITAGARDLAGNGLLSATNWTFATGAALDTTPPTVTSILPVANAVGVAPNAVLTASFSEAMAPLSLNAATFKLVCADGGAQTATIGYAGAGTMVTLTPSSQLPIGTACSATITTGAKDVAGNAMVSPFSWGFTVRGAILSAAPALY